MVSPGKSGQRLRARVDLDAGNHLVLGQKVRERHAVLGLLTDGFVVQNHAADVFARARRREQHLAVGPRFSSVDSSLMVLKRLAMVLVLSSAARRPR
jgi:hypothetical protein